MNDLPSPLCAVRLPLLCYHVGIDDVVLMLERDCRQHEGGGNMGETGMMGERERGNSYRQGWGATAPLSIIHPISSDL